MQIHGLLVLDKPGGMTSRAALDRVKRWFPRGTRIGHTGTLDPLATGVLVVCIGQATRLAEYVQAISKSYDAGLRLGVCSDTDDADGKVGPVAVERIPSFEQVRTALNRFVGEIDQVPPSFSSAKITGRRAYELARRGQTVTLEGRKVTIHAIDIRSYEFPRLEIDVHCGKGTYIRSLARDLGDALGCGALVQTLRRTRVGPFKVSNSVSLESDAVDVQSHLLPLDAAVAELPKVPFSLDASVRLCNGQSASSAAHVPTIEGQAAAAYTEDNRFIGVVEFSQTTGDWRPTKILAATEAPAD